jgi:hypothetical protein
VNNAVDLTSSERLQQAGSADANFAKNSAVRQAGKAESDQLLSRSDETGFWFEIFEKVWFTNLEVMVRAGEDTTRPKLGAPRNLKRV